MKSEKPRKNLLKIRIPAFIAIGTYIVGCLCGVALPRGASESEAPVVGTAIAELPTTEAPPPSASLTSTALPPMETPTRTASPTRTPTETPLPPQTQTALSVAASQAAQAAAATATRQAVLASRTAEAAAATSTRQAQLVTRTAGARATQAQATDIAQYAPIDWRELVNYADSHIGERVRVRGRVFNINSTTEFQMWIAGTLEAAYVVTEAPFTGLYEDDVITVYGVVAGQNCGTNAYGAEVCQPLIMDAFFTE